MCDRVFKPRGTEHWCHTCRRIASLGGIGILTPKDVASLNRGVHLAYGLLCDGQWHHATDIIAHVGQREALRRARELRKWYKLKRERIGATREFRYRLEPKTGK
jgi:hypothetical protein